MSFIVSPILSIPNLLTPSRDYPRLQYSFFSIAFLSLLAYVLYDFFKDDVAIFSIVFIVFSLFILLLFLYFVIRFQDDLEDEIIREEFKALELEKEKINEEIEEKRRKSRYIKFQKGGKEAEDWVKALVAQEMDSPAFKNLSNAKKREKVKEITDKFTKIYEDKEIGAVEKSLQDLDSIIQKKTSDLKNLTGSEREAAALELKGLSKAAKEKNDELKEKYEEASDSAKEDASLKGIKISDIFNKKKAEISNKDKIYTTIETLSDDTRDKEKSGLKSEIDKAITGLSSEEIENILKAAGTGSGLFDGGGNFDSGGDANNFTNEYKNGLEEILAKKLKIPKGDLELMRESAKIEESLARDDVEGISELLKTLKPSDSGYTKARRNLESARERLTNAEEKSKETEDNLEKVKLVTEKLDNYKPEIPSGGTLDDYSTSSTETLLKKAEKNKEKEEKEVSKYQTKFSEAVGKLDEISENIREERTSGRRDPFDFETLATSYEDFQTQEDEDNLTKKHREKVNQRIDEAVGSVGSKRKLDIGARGRALDKGIRDLNVKLASTESQLDFFDDSYRESESQNLKDYSNAEYVRNQDLMREISNKRVSLGEGMTDKERQDLSSLRKSSGILNKNTELNDVGKKVQGIIDDEEDLKGDEKDLKESKSYYNSLFKDIDNIQKRKNEIEAAGNRRDLEKELRIAGVSKKVRNEIIEKIFTDGDDINTVLSEKEVETRDLGNHIKNQTNNINTQRALIKTNKKDLFSEENTGTLSKQLYEGIVLDKDLKNKVLRAGGGWIDANDNGRAETLKRSIENSYNREIKKLEDKESNVEKNTDPYKNLKLNRLKKRENNLIKEMDDLALLSGRENIYNLEKHERKNYGRVEENKREILETKEQIKANKELFRRLVEEKEEKEEKIDEEEKELDTLGEKLERIKSESAENTETKNKLSKIKGEISNLTLNDKQKIEFLSRNSGIDKKELENAIKYKNLLNTTNLNPNDRDLRTILTNSLKNDPDYQLARKYKNYIASYSREQLASGGTRGVDIGESKTDTIDRLKRDFSLDDDQAEAKLVELREAVDRFNKSSVGKLYSQVGKRSLLKPGGDSVGGVRHLNIAADGGRFDFNKEQISRALKSQEVRESNKDLSSLDLNSTINSKIKELDKKSKDFSKEEKQYSINKTRREKELERNKKELKENEEKQIKVQENYNNYQEKSKDLKEQIGKLDTVFSGGKSYLVRGEEENISRLKNHHRSRDNSELFTNYYKDDIEREKRTFVSRYNREQADLRLKLRKAGDDILRFAEKNKTNLGGSEAPYYDKNEKKYERNFEGYDDLKKLDQAISVVEDKLTNDNREKNKVYIGLKEKLTNYKTQLKKMKNLEREKFRKLRGSDRRFFENQTAILEGRLDARLKADEDGLQELLKNKTIVTKKDNIKVDDDDAELVDGVSSEEAILAIDRLYKDIRNKKSDDLYTSDEDVVRLSNLRLLKEKIKENS